MEYVIQTRGLRKTYKDFVALNSLDLNVPKHSIFGFLGPNGAGKTTTIKLLLGLIGPSGGSGIVFGHDIQKGSIAVRDHVGYLPQDPRFYEYMTAREILRFSASFYFKGPRDRIERRVSETLDLVGLSGKADRPIKTFSGGERQRVGIGQAQVNYPDLLILDEPAASLDPIGRRDVLEVMERLREHTTIFYCTHILSDVERVSDTVAILDHGELVAQDPIEGILNESGSARYSLTLNGEYESLYKQLRTQSWVSSVEIARRNGRVTWIVNVNNAPLAEAKLLRFLLSDERVVVSDFRRKDNELEEFFLDVVKGT